MKFINRISSKIKRYNAQAAINNSNQILLFHSSYKLRNAIFTLIIMTVTFVLSTYAYGSKSFLPDAATEVKVGNLVEELHKAEAELRDLNEQVKEKYPEFYRYKKRKEALSEWYEGERMHEWDDVSTQLYSSASGEKEKKSRFEAYNTAKYFASLLFLCDLAETPDKQDLLRWLLSDERSRKNYSAAIGLKYIDSPDYIHKVLGRLKEKRSNFEERASKWCKKHPYITPMVWDQARKDAAAQMETMILSKALYHTTPQKIEDEVKYAEAKIKKIKQELEKTWPAWDNIHREFVPIVNRTIEEETRSLLNSDNFFNPTTSPLPEKPNKVTQVSANTGILTKQVTPLDKTQENTFRSRKTLANTPPSYKKHKQWWYGVIIVSAILSFFVLKVMYSKKFRLKSK